MEPVQEGTYLKGLRNSASGGSMEPGWCLEEGEELARKENKSIPHQGKGMCKVLKAKASLEQMRI